MKVCILCTQVWFLIPGHICVLFSNPIILYPFSSTGINSSTLVASQNEKDGSKKKGRTKSLKTKRRGNVKAAKEKSKEASLLGSSQSHYLKKCPSLYAPHGTNPCDYVSVIIQLFEDFKLQLRMAQNDCVTFIPWSNPITTSKKDWQADRDDNKLADINSSRTAQPLVLSVPHSRTVTQRQKEKSKKEVVEIDTLWDCAFDSDDQRLFYDSDLNVDPQSSQITASLDQTPPLDASALSPSKDMERLSPLNKDIGIDITSSNASSIINHGRKKRKLLGRKIMGSSDVTVIGSKQSSTSSGKQAISPREPVYRHTLSSSPSPNISEHEDPTVGKKR